jgi:UDPglucose 6-dehydrogenase
VALDVEAPLLSAIHRSNATHQRQIVARLETMLGGPGSLEGRRIALLGLAFKANTDDVRESPALALAANLRAAGATVLAHDPRAEARARLADPKLNVAATAEEALSGADAVVVGTEWSEYGDVDWTAAAAAMPGRLIYDTRGVVDLAAAAAAGFLVERLGRPAAQDLDALADPAATGTSSAKSS